MQHEHYLREAIELAKQSVDLGGGPFGCVIVRGGEIVGRGHNRVTPDRDPSAHAEIVAIRDACRKLGTHQLDGCDLYASCEPCPMCLGATYWARAGSIWYAADRHDAAAGGFDDAFIYDEIARSPRTRRLPSQQARLAEAFSPFEKWIAHEKRVRY